MKSVEEVIKAYRNNEFLERDDYFVRLRLNDFSDMSKIVGENWKDVYNIITAHSIDWLVRFLDYREFRYFLDERRLSYVLLRKYQLDEKPTEVRNVGNFSSDGKTAVKFMTEHVDRHARELARLYRVRFIVEDCKNSRNKRQIPEQGTLAVHVGGLLDEDDEADYRRCLNPKINRKMLRHRGFLRIVNKYHLM